MVIRVGMQVKWQGRSCVCHRIYEIKETRFAPWSSAEWILNESKIGNQKVMVQDFDEFSEGDIVAVEKQVIEFVELGKNIYYLVPYLKVKKEGNTNARRGGVEEETQAGEHPAKGGEEGTQSGQSSGEQSPS